MELRVLRYFLCVANEQNISKAALRLFITQPTLSRQIMELEQELDTKLFQRGNRNHKMTLTNEGVLLQKRAEEIVSLADKTQAEFSKQSERISGDIYIGGGETNAFRMVANAMQQLQQTNPHIRYHIFSGNADDVSEKLDKGLLDFGILIGPFDLEKYDYLTLPMIDTWGLLMRADALLASKCTIQPNDLQNQPLIVSRQTLVRDQICSWGGMTYDQLNIIATYNLIYNASLMVEAGMGCALTLNGLINIDEKSSLRFRLLEPKLTLQVSLVWKKNQIRSKASERFFTHIKQYIQNFPVING